MEISYIRDYNYQYLVIKMDRKVSDDYQVSMLLNNHISGLLALHMQNSDGENGLCYEITGMESLAEKYAADKMSKDSIETIILKFCHVVQEVNQYLLKGECILLDPEQIYVGKSEEDIYFCYYPEAQCSLRENLNSLCRFIMDHIDYDDSECVRIAYALFQESLKENVSISSIAGCIEGSNPNDAYEPAEDLNCERELSDDNDKKNENASTTRRHWRASPATVVVSILLLGVFAFEIMILCKKLMSLENNSSGILVAVAVTAGATLAAFVLMICISIKNVGRSSALN